MDHVGFQRDRPLGDLGQDVPMPVDVYRLPFSLVRREINVALRACLNTRSYGCCELGYVYLLSKILITRENIFRGK